ncbi:BAHD acyltransferase [Rosa sericea]
MATIEIGIIAKESIKPSSPTPIQLKTFNLSLLDQLAPATYIPLLLFYTTSDHTAAAGRSLQLKKSLSETLTRFYPFAGRIKDNSSIDCNDDGASFTEAQVSCLLSDILKAPDHEVLKQLLPINCEAFLEGRGCVLHVQANYFKCGGIGLGICLSHKIADAATLSTFIRSWANTASGLGQTVCPIFNTVSITPPRDISMTPPALENLKNRDDKSVTKRFVFNGSKIAALKTKAPSMSVKQATKVETVAALIWKCAMKASRTNFGSSSRLSALYQNVNIRNRTVPPLPNDSVGNFIGSFIARAEDSEAELHGLVAELRKGIEEFCKKAKRLPLSEDISVICEPQMEALRMLTSDDMDLYACTSWCRFPLYEAADFGWGKPIWVSSGIPPAKNMVFLMDTKGGDGIESWVRLSQEDMKLFECDQELLAYASLNPSIASY